MSQREQNIDENWQIESQSQKKREREIEREKKQRVMHKICRTAGEIRGLQGERALRLFCIVYISQMCRRIKLPTLINISQCVYERIKLKEAQVAQGKGGAVWLRVRYSREPAKVRSFTTPTNHDHKKITGKQD